MLFGPSSYNHVAQEYRNFSLSASGRGLSLQVTESSHSNTVLEEPQLDNRLFFQWRIGLFCVVCGEKLSQILPTQFIAIITIITIVHIITTSQSHFHKFLPFLEARSHKHVEALRPASVTTHAQRMQRQPQGGQRKIWCRSQLKQCKHMDVVYLHYLSQPVKML